MLVPVNSSAAAQSAAASENRALSGSGTRRVGPTTQFFGP